jgi:alanyl-tRNA synthetase
MALHTGQHILSRALLDEVGAQTISSRLGETRCTIDLDRETLDEAAIARAEALTNAVVDDDVLVEAFFPDAAELATLSLRRESKVTDGLRVVKVGDFDVSPCGGTHCTRSGQVGLVFVSGVERHKQRVRLSFSAGGRARSELAAAHHGLSRLASHFSCGLDDVQTAVDKLRRELGEARADLLTTRGKLAEAMTASLIASSEEGEPVIADLQSITLALLRDIAKGVAAGGRVALLACAGDDGVRVVASRPSGHDFDCKAFVARLCASSDGRGGGRPDHAEARLVAGAVWAELAAAALAS